VASTSHVKSAVLKASAKFLHLTNMLTREEDDTRIEYRLFRKEGNTMAYLLAESYHPEHTMTGIVKGFLNGVGRRGSCWQLGVGNRMEEQDLRHRASYSVPLIHPCRTLSGPVLL